MQTVQPSLFARDDTLLGVCQGIGEDLGINPFWLRLALIPLLFFYPVAAIGGYFAAGIVVLASRLIFPKPRPAAAAEPQADPGEAREGPEPVAAEEETVALAA